MHRHSCGRVSGRLLPTLCISAFESALARGGCWGGRGSGGPVLCPVERDSTRGACWAHIAADIMTFTGFFGHYCLWLALGSVWLSTA